MLEGKLVNLRAAETEDLPLIADWFNNLEVLGEYEDVFQFSKSEFERSFEADDRHERKRFVIEKKDGTKIGTITHFYVLRPSGLRLLEIGFNVCPDERGKGYGTEAVNIMVDYLFLSKDTLRIEAGTNVKNLAAQKVLENAGFKREGTMRKSTFIRGEWTDDHLYSILREEWREPRILTKR